MHDPACRRCRPVQGTVGARRRPAPARGRPARWRAHKRRIPGMPVAIPPNGVGGSVMMVPRLPLRALRRPRRRRRRVAGAPCRRRVPAPGRGSGRDACVAWVWQAAVSDWICADVCPCVGIRVEACRWPATLNASNRLARVIGCLMIVSLDWGERRAGWQSSSQTAGMPGDRGCAFAVYRSSLRRGHHDHFVRHSTAPGPNRAFGHCRAGALLPQRQAECSHGQLPIRRRSCPAHVLRARTGGSTVLTGAGRCERISWTLA